MVHPSKSNLSTKGQSWFDLLQLWVKQGLIVGVIMQILQQLAGISGILYYTPQILEQAGAGILLKWFNFFFIIYFDECSNHLDDDSFYWCCNEMRIIMEEDLFFFTQYQC
uniref:Uncharacterized protein n=1 Tax=Oryza glumipatula TaxID=40148 RepID=A0A0E0B8Q9_9ORYZ